MAAWPLALGTALPFGALSTLGTVVGLVLLVGYTRWLKGVPLLGNAVVGLLAGMALGYGGLLGGDVSAIVLPAATLGLLFGGREVLKTIYDRPGDQAQGTHTLATLAGPRMALHVAALCFALALLLLAAWARTRPAGWPALGATALAVLLILGPLWRVSAEQAQVARALRWSKALGLLALLAFSLA